MKNVVYHIVVSQFGWDDPRSGYMGYSDQEGEPRGEPKRIGSSITNVSQGKQVVPTHQLPVLKGSDGSTEILYSP